jgi:pimeloyl-ACP methyl ester carboxylesterase
VVEPLGCVLVLPGGRVRSDQAYRWWHSPNLRMMLVAAALRRRLGPGVEVRRVQYRLRGWNSPRFDAVADASAALDAVRHRFEPKSIVLVGHSMGGRVATRLAARGQVGAVVALAPYWPRDDGDLIPSSTRLLVVHGTADTRTDPESSRVQALRARQRGLDAQWVGIEGAGHSMLRPYFEWHRRTVDFVADHFGH